MKEEKGSESETGDEKDIHKKLTSFLPDRSGQQVPQAVRNMSNYVLDKGLLYRRVLDPRDNYFKERVVVLAGGLRSNDETIDCHHRLQHSLRSPAH